jgi:hypothetical protein
MVPPVGIFAEVDYVVESYEQGGSRLKLADCDPHEAAAAMAALARRICDVAADAEREGTCRFVFAARDSAGTLSWQVADQLPNWPGTA